MIFYSALQEQAIFFLRFFGTNGTSTQVVDHKWLINDMWADLAREYTSRDTIKTICLLFGASYFKDMVCAVLRMCVSGRLGVRGGVGRTEEMTRKVGR